MAPERSWDVLLLGGPSGTGKTRLAATLADRYRTRITEVDDLMLAVRRMTTYQDRPLLHQWNARPEIRDDPAERLVDVHVAASRDLAPAVTAVIGDHLDFDSPTIVEGDYLLPELATLDRYDRAEAAGRVRAVFLYEPDERQIMRNFAHREPAAGAQDKRATVSRLLGEWLRAEADRLGVPALPARPFDTLPDRVLACISEALSAKN